MSRLQNLNLPKIEADNLFSTQAERDDAKLERVLHIPLTDIDAFPDHPFLVKLDESLQAMADSIQAFGIQTPAVVRQTEDGRYELVSGHRRKAASELAGLDTLPCIVRQMSRDEAIIAMVDSNLQREVILPSEKAKSYKMRLDAMKRQGQRTDLTSVENQQKLKGTTSRQQLSEKTGESQDRIRNYLRLNELIPPILDMVDNSKMAMRPAVEMSYLNPEQQELLQITIDTEDCTPSFAQAVKIRRFAEDGRLNEDVMLSIMQEEKPNQVEQFKMPKEKISKYFPAGTPPQKMEDTIVEALKLYRQREQNRQNVR